eukprot:1098759-Prymnesium_polylepis.1
MLGTRIELAYLFVSIRFFTESNLWMTLRQLGIQGSYRKNSRTDSDGRDLAESVASFRHLDAELESMVGGLSNAQEEGSLKT